MGLSAFMLMVIFVIFDDEFRSVSSGEFMGMINFMKLMFYLLRTHNCCC